MTLCYRWTPCSLVRAMCARPTRHRPSRIRSAARRSSSSDRGRRAHHPGPTEDLARRRGPDTSGELTCLIRSPAGSSAGRCLATRACSSPARRGSSAPRSCATCGPRASPTSSGVRSAQLDLRDRDRDRPLLRRDAPGRRGRRRRAGRRDRRERDRPGRVPSRQPAHPGQRARRRARGRRRAAAASSGSSCIYPKFAAAADPRGLAADRRAGADQRRLRDREDRRDPAACRRTAGSTACAWISAMPTNLYGPGRQLRPRDTRTCCPALIRKFHEAPRPARRR